MNNEATLLSERIYAFLLKFYPKEYKEEFGDEMKYLFSESCKDAYAQAGWIGIATLWGGTSIDWLTSVVNEHLEDRKEDRSVTSTRFMPLRNAALIGFLVVFPFMLLEATTTSGFAGAGFPLALYSLMWLFAAIFILLLMPIVQTIRAGNIAMANPLFLVLKVVLMALIAWAWIALVMDQWPCFLGIPNCD